MVHFHTRLIFNSDVRVSYKKRESIAFDLVICEFRCDLQSKINLKEVRILAFGHLGIACIQLLVGFIKSYKCQLWKCWGNDKRMLKF